MLFKYQMTELKKIAAKESEMIHGNAAESVKSLTDQLALLSGKYKVRDYIIFVFYTFDIMNFFSARRHNQVFAN